MTDAFLWVNDAPDSRRGEHGYRYEQGKRSVISVSFEAENERAVRINFDPVTGWYSAQDITPSVRRLDSEREL